ncbi:MAG TPA: DUF4180 domain-containing protein [Saprospiraceae bacterium]|nr:DUF4180 domain-containing protein [Saprospiraceae bacterium]
MITHSIHHKIIIEHTTEDPIIHSAQDMLDWMMGYRFDGIEHFIIHKEGLSPDFFDLKTGLAGEILQKFSNYEAYLTIVGDFSGYDSKSLKDFISESNKRGRIRFVDNIDQAVDYYSNN